MSLKAHSIRVRLTLWHVLVLAAIILGFALGVYVFLQVSLLRQIDNHLERDFATVVRVAGEGTQQLEMLTRHGTVALFRVESGRTLTAESEGWNRAGLGAVWAGSHPVWVSAEPSGQRFRIKTATVSIAGTPTLIAVAHDGLTYLQSMHSLLVILLFSIPAALLLAVAGGYFLAGRVLAPLGALAAKAREITAERLSERLPVEDADDEFGQLAIVFNDTFLRLEDSFERLQRFTADASHELRTPLTAIRSVGEVGMQADIDAASCREVIGSMLEETDRLTKLVDSLLLLSRADAGSLPLTRERTDLVVLARDVCDCLQVLAEEKGQTLSIAAPQPVFVTVDRTTLRQALINLLDNAIKYSPDGGFIQVVVEATPDGEASIAVSDDGPGIAAEHRQRIFERFYRIDRGRSREIGGAGLGLSIVQWAVSANNGRVELEGREGKGSTFRMYFPGSVSLPSDDRG